MKALDWETGTSTFEIRKEELIWIWKEQNSIKKDLYYA